MAPLRAVGLCRRPRPPLQALKRLTGRLRPGSSTLILAPPGAGSSVLLRLISARAQCTAGQVLYNGHTAAQLEASGVQLRKLAAYGAATDDHEFLLTVRETLQFAYEAAVVAVPAQAGTTASAVDKASQGRGGTVAVPGPSTSTLDGKPASNGGSVKTQSLHVDAAVPPPPSRHSDGHGVGAPAVSVRDSGSDSKLQVDRDGAEHRWTPPDTDAVLAAMGLAQVQHTIIGNALGAYHWQ